MIGPEALEDFASSQNSINQAFVQSKEGESEDAGLPQGSPIFNADFNEEALNDTSSFFHDARQDIRKSLKFQDQFSKEDEINFNPGEVNGGPKLLKHY